MYVAGANSTVNLDFGISFNKNTATKRGGVISINDSRLVVGNEKIYTINNSAKLGAIISACNCEVDVFPHHKFYQHEDTKSQSCVLYNVPKN